jgi:hypothetical protein
MPRIGIRNERRPVRKAVFQRRWGSRRAGGRGGAGDRDDAPDAHRGRNADFRFVGTAARHELSHDAKQRIANAASGPRNAAPRSLYRPVNGIALMPPTPLGTSSSSSSRLRRHHRASSGLSVVRHVRSIASSRCRSALAASRSGAMGRTSRWTFGARGTDLDSALHVKRRSII